MIYIKIVYKKYTRKKLYKKKFMKNFILEIYTKKSKEKTSTFGERRKLIPKIITTRLP